MFFKLGCAILSNTTFSILLLKDEIHSKENPFTTPNQPGCQGAKIFLR